MLARSIYLKAVRTTGRVPIFPVATQLNLELCHPSVLCMATLNGHPCHESWLAQISLYSKKKNYTCSNCFISYKTMLNYSLELRYTLSEVDYLHDVCLLCTNLVHGIVLQEQWIWPIRVHTLTRKVSKRSSAYWETYPACSSCAHLSVY